MTRRGFQNSKRILTGGVLAISLLLAYQNCAEITEKAVFPSAAPAAVDFPYDARVEMVGFMSCEGLSPNQYDPNLFFTLAIGSPTGSNRGGLRLSDSMRTTIQTDRLLSSDVANLIAADPKATGARLQLSVRQRSALATASPSAPSGTLEARKSAAFFPVLDALVDPLYNLSPISRMTRADDGSLFRATLSFVEGNITTEFINLLASGEVSTVVGFQKNTGYQLAGVSALTPSLAYGVALEPRAGFANAISPYTFGSVPGGARTLRTGFMQRNAAVNDSSSSRTEMICPPEAQYRIVENRTWSAAPGPASAGINATVVADANLRQLNFCTQPNNPGTSANDQRAYQAANFLLNGGSGGGFWTIDQVNRCIIANNSSPLTQGTCYPAAHRAQVAIDWRPNASSPPNAMPHYFSICYLP